MAITPNNSWPVPVATDLVKNGWDAIADLGNAIDTTLGVYTPSTSGLTLVSTTSFSAVSSVSLANNTFTSTYEDYRVILKLTATSTDNNVVYLKLRASGTDSSASYYWNRYGTYTGNGTPGGTVAANNSSGIWLQSTYSTGFFPTIGRIDLFAPQLATKTAMLISTSHNSGGGDAAVFDGGGFHNAATAYDSCSFSITAGTISGKILVYGMAK
jgi:hypothetical protein